ncbi:MAG TPA: helix-turn-helix transcriptional regulator [Verrucomicrobiae bacterium]|nr:helix-turn-helix transcriptional regulator [Verrucomicrobiae bacterium]
MSHDGFNPVELDVEKTRKRWSRDPAFVEAYDALADEFAALAVRTELLRARQRADMTQADVAERMGVAQATVARLESSAGSRKHAPSISTLRRYADAVGCVLLITLAPKPVAKKASSRSGAR